MSPPGSATSTAPPVIDTGVAVPAVGEAVPETAIEAIPAPVAAAGDRRPIGVFDSGVGGLTVVAALTRRLPGESILYLGDTARLPYGTKSPATVTRYSRRNIDFLIERGVKAVVVACNTASALALPELALPLPTWGVVEPGARRAAELTRRAAAGGKGAGGEGAGGGKVGVIATESTIASDAYGQALRRVLPEVEVVGCACPLFVPLVEEGWHDDPVTEQIAGRYLGPLLAVGIDTLVLGCTHYPLLAPLLARLAGPDVALVDSAEATAREVAEGLAAAGLLAEQQPAPPEIEAGGTAAGGTGAGGSPAAAPRSEHHLCVTDNAARFARIAQLILGSSAPRLELVDL